MAFNLIEYINSGFDESTLPSDLEGLRAAAQEIQANQDLFQRLGNVSPVHWAANISSILNEVGSLDDVINEESRGIHNLTARQEVMFWLTGDAQPSRRNSILQRYAGTLDDMNRDIQNVRANMANLTDFSDFDGTPAERQELEARAAAMLEENQDLFGFAEQMGVDVPEVTRNAEGNFVRSDELSEPGREQNVGQTGQQTRIVDNGDGTWDIVGTADGTVFDTVTGSQADAIAREQELQGGSTPDAQGAFDTGAGLGDALADNVRGQEEEFIAANPSGIVTPEMRSEWLAQAWDEIEANGFYAEQIGNYESDTGQAFSRLIEDVRAQESQIARQYRQGQRNLGNDLQAKGFLFGGIRKRREGELAATTNEQLEGLDRRFGRGLEDISREAERTLGTESSEAISEALGTVEGVGRAQAGINESEFTTGEEMQIFDTSGGQTGSVPREQEAEALTRQGELEEAFTEQFSDV